MMMWPNTLWHYLLLGFISKQSLSTTATSSSHPDSRSSGRAQKFLEQVISPRDQQQNSCKPTGLIEDACCDYASIEQLNAHVYPALHDLVQRDFFRYWKVDLLRECPFWQDDDALCGNRACAVEELATPPPTDLHWSMEPALSEVTPVQGEQLEQAQQQSDSCFFRDSDFCRVEDLPPNHSNNSIFVDLIDNPERFTGYAGPSANRVWQAIYQENCFAYPAPTDASSFSVGGGGQMGSWVMPARGKESGGSGFAPLNQLTTDHPLPALIQDISAPLDPASEETCLEKRVYYRLISGLHASISIHLCRDYLDPETGEWKPNLECFITRIAEHPERLTNVYFDYVVFLRALAKAAPFIQELNICTGDEKKDADTKALIDRVISQVESTEPTFDESQMFVGPRQQLKEEFKQHFRNVSRIMDCVGCDKCRLWGGLQVSGLGTALKFLFGASDCDELCQMQITRAEVVAFFNTLHRLSESLSAIETFRTMLEERSKEPPTALPFMEQREQRPAAKPSSARPEPPVADPALDTPEVHDRPSYAQVMHERKVPARHKSKFVYTMPQPPKGDANVFLQRTDAVTQADGSLNGVAMVKDFARTLWSLLVGTSSPDGAAGKDEL